MKPTLMKYNPAFLSQEELSQSFVVRQVDLDLIIETIKENTGNSNQHILVIGPRGMGKTMLVLRAMAYINNDKELNPQWYPIVFSEESYEVFTAAEFWLRAIYHLGKQAKDENLIQVHEGLKEERDEKRLYERALACLMDFSDQHNKRLLLVVENINMLLEDQIGADETWDIRHTLLNESRIMLLGTAPSRFDEIDNAGKAMFDLFKIHHLEPLNTKDSKLLWEHLTGQEVKENKIRPIQILTGGNPRLMAIISSFAVGASFRELMKQLTFLIDEYTTYFKSNIESLPSLERKIFVTLANIWEPAEAARVGRDARIDVNKTSSLLKRLESRGSVNITKSSGRKKSYQVTERLYNIYHLMRISGRQSDRVRAVVDFMINFYEGGELVKKLSELTDDACCLDPAERKNHLEVYKDVLFSIKRDEVVTQILESTKPEFFELSDVQEFFEKEVFYNFHPSVILKIILSGQEKMNETIEDVEESIQNKLLETPNNPNLWMSYGVLLQIKSKEINEAKKAFQKAIDIDPKDTTARILLGSLYQLDLDKYDEAKSIFQEAIDIDPNNDLAWAQLGHLLHEKLGRYDEAEKAYKNAIKINPHRSWPWSKLGELLHEKLGRFNESAEAYLKALELNPQDSQTWYRYGFLLSSELGCYDEAEQAYRKAIKINPKFYLAWINLGTVLQCKGEKYDEAEKAYRKAISINPEDGEAWVFLGMFLHYISKRYNEAEKAFLKAIEIDSEDFVAWSQFAYLLHDGLKRYNEAEEAYRKSININPNYDWAWAHLGQLFHEKLERDMKRQKKLIEKLLKLKHKIP